MVLFSNKLIPKRNIFVNEQYHIMSIFSNELIEKNILSILVFFMQKIVNIIIGYIVD